MKNKKFWIAIISVVALALVIIGVTYAYWLVTKTQTNSNVISTGCLDITLNGEANDINLPNQFPMSDEEGMELTPYEFTVTNNCNTSVDYQVNLESIGTESTAIDAGAIKVAINDDIMLLSAGGDVATTISGAYAAKKLVTGTLAGSSTTTTDDTITYELRLWIDADAPISEMNKTFTSKISVTIGQGISNEPFKVGTLAYDILTNYGGSKSIISLNYEYEEKAYGEEMAVATYASNNYYWGTSYDFDSSTGIYTVAGEVVQATVAECRAGTKACGKYSTLNTNQYIFPKYIYEVSSFTSETTEDTSTKYYITAKKTGNATNGFTTNPAAGEYGLYKTKDDLGDSYFFRGDVTNNYVKFGTYATETTLNLVEDYTDDFGYYELTQVTVPAGSPMYWRIVRINGDGSIRLIYDGTTPVANGIKHTATIAASEYGLENVSNYNSSTIKTTLNNWYKSHFEGTDYEGQIDQESIFCNDTEIDKYEYYDPSGNLLESSEEAATTHTIRAVLSRISNGTPKLTCTQESDKYTTTTADFGNHLLAYPVGLLTADEAMMAMNFINSNEQYWTMTHKSYKQATGGEYVAVANGKYIVSNDTYTTLNYGVRPVINLRANVKFTGDGRIDTDSPYEIVID